MPLSEIEQVKLELGLNYFEDQDSVISDAEIDYFIQKHSGSIRRASLDVAKTMLFILSQFVHSKSGLELELWGQEHFKAYMQALKLYISDPNYSIAIQGAGVYAGGISRSDIRDNLDNPDVNPVNTPDKTPTDYWAAGEDDIFKRSVFREDNYKV